MRLMPYLLWLSLVVCLSMVRTSAAAPSCMVFGVNGHPITQGPYDVPTYTMQMRYLNSLHLRYYRVDVPLESDLSGRIRLPTPYQNWTLLLEVAAAANPPITILPSIFPTDLPYTNVSYADLRHISYQEGAKWATLYGHLFDIFELSNERDNVCIHNSDGVDPVSGYNQTCLTHLMAQMTGFAAGVKSVQPHLRIIIDYSWVHFGYLDALVAHDMQWDVLAPHWYGGFGPVNMSYKDIPDVLQWVIDRYHKPIWITETNSDQGSWHLPPANQTQYITDTLRIIEGYDEVQAYMIYELLDEKQWGNDTSEAYMGLLAPDGKGGWTWKMVGDVYGKYVANYTANVCKRCEFLSEQSSVMRCVQDDTQESMVNAVEQRGSQQAKPIADVQR